MIVDARLKVHRWLGPGLLESAYELCLAHELSLRGVTVRRQMCLPIIYDGATLDAGYRLDLLVTYLRLSGHRLAFLINFNVSLFKQGVKRFVV